MKNKKMLAFMLTIAILVGFIVPVPVSAVETESMVDNAAYLETTGWSVSSTIPATTSYSAITMALFDEDPNTGWTSANMQSGEWQQVIQIDMGQDRTFDTIYIECPSTTEYGRQYTLQDSSNWFQDSHSVTTGQSGVTKITLSSPRTARQINIWQSGTADVPWTVARIRVANGLIPTDPTPPTLAEGAKKGVASYKYSNTDISKLSALNTGWFYNWGYSCTSDYASENMEYVPMVWGAGTASDQNLATLKQGKENGLYTNLLGFNEPDLTEQSNMTVQQCMDLWPKLMDTGLRLGSPAPANYSWIDSFMSEANRLGYRVDFISLHFYPDFTNPNAVNDLKNILTNIYNKYKKPIWITELGTVDINSWGIPTSQPVTQALADNYLSQAVPMLESLGFVERYAWFDDNCYSSESGKYSSLYNLSDELTSMGTIYKNLSSDQGMLITTMDLQPGNVGIAYTDTTIEKTGGTAPYTWSVTGLPTGLSLNAETGVISGTPTVPGTYQVTVTVTDSKGQYISSMYDLTINGSGSSDTTLPRSGWVASAYANSTNAGNAIDSQLSTMWQNGEAQLLGGKQWFQVNMGAVQTFDAVSISDNGSGDYPRAYEIYVSNDGTNWGTAIASGSGTLGEMRIEHDVKYAQYVRVVQTGEVNNHYWSLADLSVYRSNDVPVNHAPILNSISNKASDEGQPVTFQVSATDADSDTLTYSIIDLPSGAEFDVDTRTFKWIPNSSQLGTHPVTFTVSDGKVSDSETINITVTFSTLPGKPTNLIAGKCEETSLSFNWTPPADNYTGFEIYRCNSEIGTYTKIGASSEATSFTDTELSNATTYYYKVKTINEKGQSEFSDALSMETLAAGLPANVTDLSITEENDFITLSWTAAENASSYEVYRATGKYSNYELYNSSATTSFSDNVIGEKYRYYYKVCAVNIDGIKSVLSDDISLEGKLFGNTMNFYSTTDSKTVIDTMTAQTATKMIPMATAEFSNDRYAFMFKPGKYNINRIDVGYYTSVYGLGATPLETTIPRIEVSSWGDNSLTHFWRSVENIGIDTGSATNEVKWAASQAAPARRLYVNGKFHFDDIGKPASGGYLADSLITGQTGSWSQQQYFLRNNKLTGGWYDGVWNMLFVGTENSPLEKVNWADTAYQAYTVEKETPIVREKPFLYLNSEGNYAVFVPGIRENSIGVSWSEGNPGVGKSISIDDFYVAKAADDTADTINTALAQGKHLLLTPGIYRVDKPIKVDNENTVVLGIGMATIVPTSGNDAMQIADVDGVTVAGVLFDAGEAGSEHLLQVGPEGSSADHSANPTLLADVFTRVGGAVDGKANITVEINSNNVIGDHFWLWRADHGMTSESTGWNKNIGKNGVVVNGDDVTIYGLFVEHFQEYQTLWNGENGSTYFYQSEIPYDVPYQKDYMSHDGTVKGYSSYKVSDSVKSHYAVALGIYNVFIHTLEPVELENAMEVSDGTVVKHVCSISLGGNGVTNHIVNGIGSAASGGTAQKVGIDNYYVERIPLSNTASYNGATGTLTISGKNYDYDELDWSKLKLQGENTNLTFNEAMVESVDISLYTITITFSDTAREEVAEFFGYINGIKETGITLSAEYMTGGTNTVLDLETSSLEKIPVNKTDLQGLYNANKDKEQGNYTAASWLNFVNALNNTKAVLDKVDATQTEVDNQLQALNVAINSLVVNRIPTLESIENKNVNEGQMLNFQLSASDEDGDTLALSSTDLPAGATFTTAGAFSWTPSDSQAGTYTVTFTVSDGTATDSDTISITVNNVSTGETGGTGGTEDTDGISGSGSSEATGTDAQKPGVVNVVGKVENTNAVAAVSSDDLKIAFEQVKANDSGVKIVTIIVKPVEGVNEYTLKLPATEVSSKSDDKKLEVNTQLATVTLPQNILKVKNANTAELVISVADITELSDTVKKLIGNRPVVELNFKLDGKVIEWNNSNAPVRISLDYTPTEEEMKDTEHIVVYYIDGKGNLIAVPSGRYDKQSGKVTFTTTHFSKYAIAFVKKTFDDLDSYKWAKKQIEVLASHGIIGGVSKTEYGPKSKITRGDFMVLLIKTLGLEAEFDINFSDLKPTDYYYKAIGIAKKYGITNGIGHNEFDPKGYISRQDVMVIVSKALEVAKTTDISKTSANINKFSDSSEISSYALKAAEKLVGMGILVGSNNRLNPKDELSRAETAVIIYNLYTLN